VLCVVRDDEESWLPWDQPGTFRPGEHPPVGGERSAYEGCRPSIEGRCPSRPCARREGVWLRFVALGGGTSAVVHAPAGTQSLRQSRIGGAITTNSRGAVRSRARSHLNRACRGTEPASPGRAQNPMCVPHGRSRRRTGRNHHSGEVGIAVSDRSSVHGASSIHPASRRRAGALGEVRVESRPARDRRPLIDSQASRKLPGQRQPCSLVLPGRGARPRQRYAETRSIVSMP
jgi:hypothetical protein